MFIVIIKLEIVTYKGVNKDSVGRGGVTFF